MATFVLVHGSWHDGSAFASTAKHLQNRGHTALAPTMVGHGKDVDKGVDHAACAQSVVDYIRGRSLTDIILVGHSFAGSIVPKVAEAVPEKVRRVVFLNAFVLADGGAMLDEIPPQFQAAFAQMAAAAPDNTMMVPFDLWRDAFLTDADPDLVQATYDQLSPEPFQPWVDKIDLKRFYSLDIPRSVIVATGDRTLPEGEYHPRMSSRLQPCPVLEMPGSHEIMFSNPQGLAEKIIEASRD